MSLDPEFMQLLRVTFQGELAEQLQQITDGLLGLEKGLTGDARQDVLNAMFRSAHNIKGAARGIDATAIAELAHQIESLFGAFRTGRPVEPKLIDLCLEVVDALRDLSGLDNADPPAGLMERLHDALLGGSTAAAAPPADTAAPTAPVPVAHPVPDAPADRAAQQAAAPDTAPTPPPQPQPERRLRRRSDAAEPESLRVSLSRLNSIAALAEDLQMARIAMGEHFNDLQSLEQQLRKIETLLRPFRHAEERLHAPHADIAPEFVQAAKQTLTAFRQLRRNVVTLGKSMRATVGRTHHLNTALQGDIRMLQLVPVSTMLRPMARMARDIGRELGKLVELHIDGDQIEVDRAVLDGLRDPLTHLLRNAIDHGLELPDERRAAAKAETGNIWVDVASAGGQIVLAVKDDGRGIDAEKIGEIALRRQLVQAEELAHLDEQAKLTLIFRPGFSTRDAVTELSGRGVGLDVVMANVRKLKGTVGLGTQPGRGTTFTLTLPLTLSTERGLHVRAGGENLLIPSIAVDSVREIERSEILHVAASQTLLLAGQSVPLRDLAATLDLPTRIDGSTEGPLQVVVLSKAWSRVAFLVDEVVGEREIVIKRLPPPLHTAPNISGATLTGRGEIVMVLHADELVVQALRHHRPALLPQVETTGEKARPAHILVCDDSITTRTLQKNLLESKGYRVTLATDGQMGWELLQNGDFDVVVTDIEMPRMNGIELTDQIRKSKGHEELPVIIVSSLAREEDRLRGMQVGADAYIVKGEFESQAMLDALSQLI